MPELSLAASPLDLEQVRDLRRTVLCGELNWGREAVDDGWDRDAAVVLALEAGKPVATGRLAVRAGLPWLELVAVLPRARRRGLGRALTAFLEARSGDAARRDVLALATPLSAPFFQACGYAVERDDGGVLLLRKVLGGTGA